MPGIGPAGRSGSWSTRANSSSLSDPQGTDPARIESDLIRRFADATGQRPARYLIAERRVPTAPVRGARATRHSAVKEHKKRAKPTQDMSSEQMVLRQSVGSVDAIPPLAH